MAGVAVLLTGVVFLAFGHSLFQGYAPIDDIYLMAQNLVIRGPTLEHLKTIFTTYDPELYIPVTFFSFQLNYLISGLEPWSFHLINILLHAANAFLVWLLIRRITAHDGIALFCGLIFATHPLMTESVVWLLARKDLLATFFALATLVTYTAEPLTRRRYGASIVFFVLALLSKPSTATLPVILLLLELTVQRRSVSQAVRRLWPFALLMIVALLVGLGGKGYAASRASLWFVGLLPGRSVLLAIRLFFFPGGLHPLYEVPSTLTPFSPGILLPFFIVLAGCVFLFHMIRRRSPLSIGPAFFLLALLPTFPAIVRGNAVFFTADHYLYFPAVGILLAIGMILPRIARSIGAMPRTLSVVASSIVILLLSLLSVRQTRLWDSIPVLFSAALKANPSSVVARTALAGYSMNTNRLEDAFAVLKEGLRYGEDARLHLAAGMVYAKAGQVADAMSQFTKAKELDPQNPEPIYAMGSVEEQTGKEEQALAHFREALALDPSYVAAQLGIGRVLQNRGDFPAAEREFRQALRWNGNSADAHRGLARALMKQGKADEAEEHRLLAEEIERYAK